MDQLLVHTSFWGNSYGPMVLKVRPKFPPTLVLVHGWLFPVHVFYGRENHPVPAASGCQRIVPLRGLAILLKTAALGAKI